MFYGINPCHKKGYGLTRRSFYDPGGRGGTTQPGTQLAGRELVLWAWVTRVGVPLSLLGRLLLLLLLRRHFLLVLFGQHLPGLLLFLLLLLVASAAVFFYFGSF